MEAKRKELLEVRDSTATHHDGVDVFGDDESNINQVAEHPYVEKHIAAFLPSRRRTSNPPRALSILFFSFIHHRTDRARSRIHAQDTDLERFAVVGTEEEWASALHGASGRSNKVLSVKRKAGSKDKHAYEPKPKKVVEETPDADKRTKKEKRDKKFKKSSASKRMKGT